MYRAALAQARGDAAGTAEHAQRALDLAGPDDHLARGGAAGFLGFAAWARGDVSTALETFTQAVASLHAAGNLVDELSGTVVLGDLWLAAGPAEQGPPALYAGSAGGRGTRRTGGAGNRRAARGAERAGRRSGRPRQRQATPRGCRSSRQSVSAMNEGRYRWFVAMGLARQSRRRPGEAVVLLDQAGELYRPGFFPDVRPIPALKARIWIAQGNLADAGDWARDRGVSVTDDASYLKEFDHLTLVRLLLARQRAHPDHRRDRPGGRSVGPAAPMPPRPPDAPAVSSKSACCGPWSTTRRDVDRGPGLPGPSRGAEAPEPEGYVRLFLDEGAADGRACCATPSVTASPATTRDACSAGARSEPGDRLDAAPGRRRLRR